MDNQQLKSLANDKYSLDIEVAAKKNELGKLLREIEQAKFQLDQIRKSYKEDINNLSTKVSTLRTLNSTADFMNKHKVEEFRTLRDVIGTLESKYNKSKEEIEKYRIQEINKVHAETNAERIKILNESVELDKNKEAVSKLLRSLKEKVSLYDGMVKNTVSLQAKLKIDYMNLRVELNKITTKKSLLTGVIENIDAIYQKAEMVLAENIDIRNDEIAKSNEINQKLSKINNIEKHMLDKIYRGNIELGNKKQELLQLEDSLKVKKVQLDDRQQVLESAFQELRQLKSGVL